MDDIQKQIDRLRQEVDCVAKTPYSPMLVIKARIAVDTLEAFNKVYLAAKKYGEWSNPISQDSGYKAFHELQEAIEELEGRE